jgi:hypothetical protein
MRDNWINPYAVGMNVFIGRDADGYRAESGVIIDWDSYCAKEQLWHENIGKCDLKRPFFSILRNDGTEIYISEGRNSNQLISNVGKNVNGNFYHFSIRENFRYQPMAKANAS